MVMSLKVAVQMDPVERINIAGDSTFALMLEAQARGHALSVYTPETMSLRGSRLSALTRAEIPDGDGTRRLTLNEAADFATKWLTWGAGPRASMNLILAAKANAVVESRILRLCIWKSSPGFFVIGIEHTKADAHAGLATMCSIPSRALRIFFAARLPGAADKEVHLVLRVNLATKTALV